MIPKYVENWYKHAHYHDLKYLKVLADEVMKERDKISSLTSEDLRKTKDLRKVQAIKYIRDKYKIPLGHCIELYNEYY